MTRCQRCIELQQICFLCQLTNKGLRLYSSNQKKLMVQTRKDSLEKIYEFQQFNNTIVQPTKPNHSKAIRISFDQEPGLNFVQQKPSILPTTQIKGTQKPKSPLQLQSPLYTREKSGRVITQSGYESPYHVESQTIIINNINNYPPAQNKKIVQHSPAVNSRANKQTKILSGPQSHYQDVGKVMGPHQSKQKVINNKIWPQRCMDCTEPVMDKNTVLCKCHYQSSLNEYINIVKR